MDKWLGGQELSRFSKSSCEDVRLTLHNWGVGRYLDMWLSITGWTRASSMITRLTRWACSATYGRRSRSREKAQG